jgi:hypothetical protein
MASTSGTRASPVVATVRPTIIVRRLPQRRPNIPAGILNAATPSWAAALIRPICSKPYPSRIR